MKRPMRLALIADAFPPMRTSAAVQISDLADELAMQGNQVTILLPRPHQTDNLVVDRLGNGVEIVGIRTPRVKDRNYFIRLLAEFATPYIMLMRLRISRQTGRKFDGVIWYSPSIFFSPLVRALKRANSCRSYLILRDLFPQWALDMGLMRKGPAYWILEAVARRQYAAADVIGVQAAGNLEFFPKRARQGDRRVEVLQNWLSARPDVGTSLDLEAQNLAGRRLILYTGNLGVAQGADAVIDLAEGLRDRPDLAIVLIGRGSEIGRLRDIIKVRGIGNVVIHDEVDSSEIPALLARASVGLVMLDPRHSSHNIPGKFVAYLTGGLPVIALVSTDSDLADVIRRHDVGLAVDPTRFDLVSGAASLIDHILGDAGTPARCLKAAQTLFSPGQTARQIVDGLDAAQ